MALSPRMAALGAKLQAKLNAQDQADIYGPANAYKAALMGAAGEQVSAGVPQINSYLAGAGPLADSGARAALAARLSGKAYGGVQTGYAQYLAALLRARQAFRYQSALLKQQRQAQQTGIGGVLGGIGGAVLGGPIGGAIGSKILGGGGGGGYSYGNQGYGTGYTP